HGTAQTAGIILAAMQFVGILAGLAFSPLTQLFRDRLLLVSGVAYGVGQLLIGVSPNLLILALVTIASGFAYSVALTTVYNVLSDKMPAGVLSQATSMAVLGCSTGSIATTFVLSLLGTISSTPAFIFGFSGILMILISFFGLWIVRKSGK
ncbi:MAG: MFS transporter, partial [Streptococcus parasanguinis]|nr:MFS transporter [Streptococcus parasanguinis]